MVQVDVTSLALDTQVNAPVVFLKERDGTKILPIWIGFAEAASIARALEHIKPERPLTHDLMAALLNGMDAKLLRIVINKVENDTYYARIYLQKDSHIIEIDARPSDSIALALRMGAPIYIENEVMEKAIDLAHYGGLKENLMNVEPEKFGELDL